MATTAIIVTGLPAGGKTSVARRLSSHLAWPILDKDDILESLFEHNSVHSPVDRRRLSKLSDERFEHAAQNYDQVILVSHWRPRSGPKDTGTPPDFVATIFDRVIEVHCNCDVSTAATRFRLRKRHKSHLDALKSEEEILGQIRSFASGYPLGLGRLTPRVRLTTTAYFPS